MTSPAGDVLAESRVLAVRLLRAAGRRIPEIVTWLGVLITVLAVLALAGAFFNDARIATHRATTAATVLDGSTHWRTIVQFTDDEGRLRTPAVLYPSGLDVGDNIYVEYDSSNPERVRVAGRGAVQGLLPIGIGVVVFWALLYPLVLRLRRLRGRRGAASGQDRPDQSR